MVSDPLYEELIQEYIHNPGQRPEIVEAFGRQGVKKSHINFALSRQERSRETLPEIMRDLGVASTEVVAKALASNLGVPFLPMNRIDDIAHALMPGSIRDRAQSDMVPVAYDPETDTLLVALEDPNRLVEARNAFYPHSVRMVMSTSEAIQTAYRRLFAGTEKAFLEAVSGDPEDPRYYRNILEAIIRHAAFIGVNDIHFTPTNRGGFIRLRMDGSLMPFYSLSSRDFSRLIGIMRVDGRINELVNTQEGSLEPPDDLKERYGLRLQLSVSVRGVAGNIRVLDRQGSIADFDSLAFDEKTARQIRLKANSSAGMMLITGPTGSGKTTTLYAILKLLDPMATSIQTVENPVEYHTGAWHQFETRRGTGADEGKEWQIWFKGLLRNDLDVGLLGEVRDRDTGRSAIQLASTGHLVFTTLHTNSATRAVTRLTEMGLNPLALADVLVGVLAQRLVRRLCPHCREADHSEETWRELREDTPSINPETDLKDVTLYKASEEGCPHCNYTGYRGRLMVYELLDVSAEVARMIARGASGMDLLPQIPPAERMWGRGIQYVLEGKTSLEELHAEIIKE